MNENISISEMLPANVKRLLDILQSAGHEAYIVGGCVRDSLLSRVPNDWDICTSAKPDELISLLHHSGINVILTGLKHGTITAILDKMPYEITTFRIDGHYSDNRRPDQVTFTDDIVQDLSRRDFTINAMAYNPHTDLVDPFDGQSDIQRRLIKCVGNPEVRFHEDALRILRAFRFSAQLGFTVEENTLLTAKSNANLLKNISAERIRDELCKIVVCESWFAS